MKRVAVYASTGAIAALLFSCGGPHSFSCVTNLPGTCEPLYVPTTFDNVFSHTLNPTCAQPGGTCHSSDGQKGGLVFENADRSYALLLGQVDGKKRVLPMNASCSLLVERIELLSSDPYVMPPGMQLSAPERCAIEMWIQAGAMR
jgi:hypothetical protein